MRALGVVAVGLACLSACCRDSPQARGGMKTPAGFPSLDRIAAVARAQVALPDGRVTDLRHESDDTASELWAVTVEGEGRRANAIVRVSGGRVTVPAGYDQAGRELVAMTELAHPAPGLLTAAVVAVGGAMPGWPDFPQAEEKRHDDGSVTITVTAPESWIAYAASGGVGAAPASRRGGGIAPPEAMAKATLEVGADRALGWSFDARGRTLATCAARPARSSPSFPEEQLVRILAAARRGTRAPRAMPLSTPRALDPSLPGIIAVELCRLGMVYVDLEAGDLAEHHPIAQVLKRLHAIGVSLDAGAQPSGVTAAPSLLLPLLEALGALPPGLLASDMLATARIAGGELTADVAAPLVEWSAGGASADKILWGTPRAAVRMLDAPPAPSASKGRVRVRLDEKLDWKLEISDGAGAFRALSR